MKAAFLLVLAVVAIAGCVGQGPAVPQLNETAPVPPPALEEYAPQINPADFVAAVTNKYFTLTPRTKFTYEGVTEEGTESVETYVTNQTRIVMGVAATVVWDRVWLNGSLVEETYDWYAQDSEGNVWYFGEDSKEIVGGTIISRAGSWEAGVDGALPGIIMKADPQVGEAYRQEYYAGIAEDAAEVVSLGESVSVPAGFYTGCLKTRDYTPLEPGADEHKYYCPAAGGAVLEVVIEDGQSVELVSIERNAEPTPAQAVEGEIEPVITEEEAKEIGLREVPGTVTDVAIEKKFRKLAYVVEIIASADGVETDVIVDVDTGEVLGIER